MELPITLNSEPVKYLLLAVTSPFWMPFFRALYEEFNNSILDEGGLFGDPPPPEEAERIRRERIERGEALRSIPHDAAGSAEEDLAQQRSAGTTATRRSSGRRGFR